MFNGRYLSIIFGSSKNDPVEEYHCYKKGSSSRNDVLELVREEATQWPVEGLGLDGAETSYV